MIRINILYNVLANTSYHTAEAGVTTTNASKQHVHVKFYILSLESKYIEVHNMKCALPKHK